MCQIKAPIAGNSMAIAKIGNAELAHFNKQMLIHELIRGSLIIQLPKTRLTSFRIGNFMVFLYRAYITKPDGIQESP
jgi:hypothetical protein